MVTQPPSTLDPKSEASAKTVAPKSAPLSEPRKTPWTPGPWTLHCEHESLWGNSGQSRQFEIQNDDGVVLRGQMANRAALSPDRSDNAHQPYANARLIAEAPAMVDVIGALMESVKALDEDYDQRHSYQTASALLARLGGG